MQQQRRCPTHRHARRRRRTQSSSRQAAQACPSPQAHSSLLSRSLSPLTLLSHVPAHTHPRVSKRTRARPPLESTSAKRHPAPAAAHRRLPHASSAAAHPPRAVQRSPPSLARPARHAHAPPAPCAACRGDGSQRGVPHPVPLVQSRQALPGRLSRAGRRQRSGDPGNSVAVVRTHTHTSKTAATRRPGTNGIRAHDNQDAPPRRPPPESLLHRRGHLCHTTQQREQRNHTKRRRPRCTHHRAPASCAYHTRRAGPPCRAQSAPGQQRHCCRHRPHTTRPLLLLLLRLLLPTPSAPAPLPAAANHARPAAAPADATRAHPPLASRQRPVLLWQPHTPVNRRPACVATAAQSSQAASAAPDDVEAACGASTTKDARLNRREPLVHSRSARGAIMQRNICAQSTRLLATDGSAAPPSPQENAVSLCAPTCALAMKACLPLLLPQPPPSPPPTTTPTHLCLGHEGVLVVHLDRRAAARRHHALSAQLEVAPEGRGRGHTAAAAA